MTDPEIVDIVSNVAEEVATSGATKIGLATVAQLRKRKSYDKIKRIFNLSDNYSPTLAIYMSMFIDFKKDGYTLENINQKICALFNNFEFEEESKKIKFKEAIFEIYHEYKFADNVYTKNEMLELESPIDDKYEEILIPLVTGISIYLYPENDTDRNIEKQLMVGYCFLDEFEKGLREYHIVNEGKYLYIMTLSYDDKIKLKSFLEERYEKIRSYEDKIRFLPSLDTEIKITLDKLIAERIGKILQNN